MPAVPEHSMTLDDEQIIVVPDVHEDIAWLDKVLWQSRDATRIVLLGDLFDRKPEDGADPRAALDYYLRFLDDERITLLWGNHDILVFASWYARRFLGGALPARIHEWVFDAKWLYFPFEQFPRIERLFRKFQPFVLHGDWLLSHAGIHSGLLPENPELEDLDALHIRAQSNLWNFHRLEAQPAEWACGAVRGGPPGMIGGLSWQDFRHEFQDSLPWPQIVGHTRLATPAKTGRSICLDAGQTAWMRVERNGHYNVIGDKCT